MLVFLRLCLLHAYFIGWLEYSLYSSPDLLFLSGFLFLYTAYRHYTQCLSLLPHLSLGLQPTFKTILLAWTGPAVSVSFNGAKSLCCNFFLQRSPLLSRILIYLCMPMQGFLSFFSSLHQNSNPSQDTYAFSMDAYPCNTGEGRSSLNNWTPGKEKQHLSQLKIVHEAEVSGSRWVLPETLNGFKLQRSFKYFPCHLNFNLQGTNLFRLDAKYSSFWETNTHTHTHKALKKWAEIKTLVTLRFLWWTWILVLKVKSIFWVHRAFCSPGTSYNVYKDFCS